MSDLSLTAGNRHSVARDLGGRRMTHAQEWMFYDLAHEIADSPNYSRSITGATKFPYILLDHSYFKAVVGKHLKPGMCVVDVGCGAGDKLVLFRELEPTCHVTGIEYVNLTARFARYVAPFAHVIEGDALEQDYSRYDLIYMYRPMSNNDFQYTLEDRVMSQMKSGATLVVCSASHVNMPLEVGWVKR